jgi:hypothetical protein
MADSVLFDSVDSNRERARKLRKSAREGRAGAEATIARARRLRQHVEQLDTKVQEAKPEVKRQRTLREVASDALKQSLHDLESVRMVLSGDRGLDRLKTDIRKTLGRSR